MKKTGALPYQNILDEFVSITRQVMENKLTGIYLHGSLAMGCFHPAKSDIDLIVIVEDNITDIQKIQFMEHIVRLNRHAPAKGIDKNPVYIVLNLCRVVAFVKDELYLSKEKGGRWALDHLRLRTSGLITDALECYATDKDMNADRDIAGRFVREICDILK